MRKYEEGRGGGGRSGKEGEDHRDEEVAAAGAPWALGTPQAQVDLAAAGLRLPRPGRRGECGPRSRPQGKRRGREGFGRSRPAPLHPERTFRREVQVEGEPGPPALSGYRREPELRCGAAERPGEREETRPPRREGETASPSHGSDGAETLLFNLAAAGDPPTSCRERTPRVIGGRSPPAPVRLSAEQAPLPGCGRAILNLF